MTRTRLIFLSAAIVNALVAALFLAAPYAMYASMVNGEAPENAAGVMYLFGTAVAVFGLGYYWVSVDFKRNRPLAELAVYGKLGVFGVAILGAALGAISLGRLAGALIDLIYSLLFLHALKINPAEDT